MKKNEKIKKYEHNCSEARKLSSGQFRCQVIPDKRKKSPKHKHKVFEEG